MNVDLEKLFEESKAARDLLAELERKIEENSRQRDELIAGLSEGARFLLNGLTKEAPDKDLPARNEKRARRAPAQHRPRSGIVKKVFERIGKNWSAYRPFSRAANRRASEHATLAYLTRQGKIERRGLPHNYEYRRLP